MSRPRVNDGDTVLDFTIEPAPDPHRSLLASVVQMAIIDLKVGTPEDMISAYEWISRRRSTFDWFCGLLDMQPDRVRERLTAVYRARYEQMLTKIRERSHV